MKLHDRSVRTGFWTDGKLKRACGYNPLGRLLYEGLWMLADDSGCVEYDVEEFNLQLFAGENIETTALSQLCDSLVTAQKLLPYQAQGKECLFLVNFHKHQRPPNPGKPEVPLPSWISWTPSENRYRGGRYQINGEALARALGRQPCDSPVTGCTSLSTSLSDSGEGGAGGESGPDDWGAVVVLFRKTFRGERSFAAETTRSKLLEACEGRAPAEVKQRIEQLRGLGITDCKPWGLWSDDPRQGGKNGGNKHGKKRDPNRI